MSVKDTRCVRAAKRSSVARSLTDTAAEGTSPRAGATLFIMGRSRPFRDFPRVPVLASGLCKLLLGNWLRRAGAENRKENREENRFHAAFPMILEFWPNEE